LRLVGNAIVRGSTLYSECDAVLAPEDASEFDAEMKEYPGRSKVAKIET
jgi:hypothetical protein